MSLKLLYNSDDLPADLKLLIRVLCRTWSARLSSARHVIDEDGKVVAVAEAIPSLALQLPFLSVSESMGNHDSQIVDAGSVN
jgi:hypothetical protein